MNTATATATAIETAELLYLDVDYNKKRGYVEVSFYKGDDLLVKEIFDEDDHNLRGRRNPAEGLIEEIYERADELAQFHGCEIFDQDVAQMQKTILIYN